METLNVKKVKDYYEVNVNSKIYPMDIIYSAAYVLLDKAYIVFDEAKTLNTIKFITLFYM